MDLEGAQAWGEGGPRFRHLCQPRLTAYGFVAPKPFMAAVSPARTPQGISLPLFQVQGGKVVMVENKDTKNGEMGPGDCASLAIHTCDQR